MHKVSICDEQWEMPWTVLVAVGDEVLDELCKGHAIGLRFSEYHVTVEGQGVIVDGEGAVQPSDECSFALLDDSSFWSPFSDDGGVSSSRMAFCTRVVMSPTRLLRMTPTA